ncbi:MAG TPA: GNAT family N-acetyltransferase [Thermoanaerobaculia bacterium]|nr:GNAT family N-acetyltransferase [Thermoanaerobaculia bacterium]HQR67897.1 GNAT family N-acetyltransferase [Thermoanaerobaculia bacterium]
MALAFPRYRRDLLDLGPKGRAVAVGADVLGEPWGLALVGLADAGAARLLSVAVIERARRRGLATRMLAELEENLRARGVSRLVAAYRGDRPHSQATDRLLRRRGFEPLPGQPVLELRYRTARLLESPALYLPCEGAEVVPYSAERLGPLLELGEESGLAPANVLPAANDPTLATLVALDGEVAACMLGFRAAPDTGHVALLFVRRELRRRGLAAFATRGFVLRLVEQGLAYLSCEVRLSNAACLPYTDGKLAPVIDSRAIVHSVGKSL